jgi:hypothetical protein
METAAQGRNQVPPPSAPATAEHFTHAKRAYAAPRTHTHTLAVTSDKAVGTRRGPNAVRNRGLGNGAGGSAPSAKVHGVAAAF